MTEQPQFSETSPSRPFRSGIQLLAKRYELGMPLRSYAYSRWFWLLFAFALLGALIWGFNFYEDIHFYVDQKAENAQYIHEDHLLPNDPVYKLSLHLEQSYHDSIIQDIWNIPVFMILLIGSFIIFRQRVYLYSDGLLYCGTFKKYVLHWDEITELTEAGHLLLRRPNGRYLTLQLLFRNFKELQALVEKEMVPRLLPPLIAQYESGEPVLFGEVRVDTSGITYMTKSFSWERLNDIRLAKDGQIEFQTAGRWTRGDVGLHSKNKGKQIPNTPILVALVKHILQQLS